VTTRDARTARRRRRRRPSAAWILAIVAAVVLFAVGIALGMALHDNPKPDLSVTTTKTIVP
jgi:multisubunit Na+/H+ antiporter MnhB subunit